MVSSLRATYDREFAAVKDDIIKMGSLVDAAISKSMQSLQERDQIMAQQIIDHDETINALRFKVEEACLTLIATQQPAASDLRDVIAAMSIVVEMERMADHASGIAKTVIRMGDEPLLKPLIDLPRMAQLAREMLREGLDSFITRDVQKARWVATRDDEMDLLNRAIFDELVEIMAHRPDGVERATYLLWCSHNLERIGDRVTNIVERVVFMTTGDMEDLND